MSNTPKKRAKRIVLVNRDLQLRYAKLAMLVGLLSSALSIFIILFPLFHFRILKFPTFLPWPFMVALGLTIIVNLVSTAVFTIFLTHRIAGPVFALIRQIRELQKGVWNINFQVRKTDELKYLVRHFNDLSEHLVNTATDDLELVLKIEEGLANLSLKHDNDTSESLQLTLEQLRQLKGELEKRIHPAVP